MSQKELLKKQPVVDLKSLRQLQGIVLTDAALVVLHLRDMSMRYTGHLGQLLLSNIFTVAIDRVTHVNLLSKHIATSNIFCYK